MSTYAAPGYLRETVPDLSSLSVRERLSQSGMEGFFAIVDKWGLPMESAGDLLGGVPRSTLYKLKTASGTLRQDELMRISYVLGIYKALHILLPDDMADRWMTRPNDNTLFQGTTPLNYAVREGIPGLQQIRSLLDAERGGH